VHAERKMAVGLLL